MCGLAGIFDIRSERPIDRCLLQSMTDVLAHRGPDGDGFHVSPGMGLGHRRLAIIDLHTGDQPIYNDDKTAVVVFNGEIYNFREVRRDLEARGIRFHTKGDTEVILRSWEVWGEDCVAHLRGMFVIAIWDSRHQSLFLARDRLGKKPLYYTVSSDGRLYFASEMKSVLLAPGLKRDIDPHAVEDYFAYGYVPDPKTIYRTVHKLAPASLLCVRRGAEQLRPRRYWDVDLTGVAEGTEGELAGELVDRLREAVDIRRVSDVPIGAFASGGVDSSAVVALMADVSDEPVNTFNIAFRAKEYDESAYAAQHAKRYGTNHVSRMLESDGFEHIDRLAEMFDEPFGDSSALPTYMVSAAAREQVTVIQSGDGGDELFAGYRRYLWHVQEERVRSALPKGLRRHVFGGLASVYPKMDWAPRLLRAKTTFAELALDSTEAYFLSVSRLSDPLRASLYSGDFQRDLNGYHAIETLRTHMAAANSDDPLRQAQYADLQMWLPGDILTKVDRASMAASLETRAPLLDHKFVEWSMQLPTALKLKGRTGKYILKKAMEPWVSKDILYRPKMGFSIPIDQWFRGPLQAQIRQAILGGELQESGMFESKTLESLLEQHRTGRRNHAAVLWSLLMFDAFLRRIHRQTVPPSQFPRVAEGAGD